METVKRIEIVILEVKADDLCEELLRKGVKGFTLVRGAEGFGDRGRRYGDELTGVSQNACVLLCIKPELLDTVLKVVRPALHEFGGICLVSDAESLPH